MNYTAGAISDAGIRKKTNQDAFLYDLAEFQGRKLAFLVICDGMGGLEKGEIASAEVLNTFGEWFRRELSGILEAGFSAEALREIWFSLAETENRKISHYADYHDCRMGTTLTAVLFLDEQYYAIHIGDCRLYEIRQDQVLQLTHDHTVTQREIDNGNLSPELAETDSRKHILLQCIGAGRPIAPDFLVGTVRPGTSYLLCCDGFRHRFSPDEMLHQLSAGKNPTRRLIEKNLSTAVAAIKARGEKDNITAGLLTAGGPEPGRHLFRRIRDLLAGKTPPAEGFSIVESREWIPTGDRII